MGRWGEEGVIIMWGEEVLLLPLEEVHPAGASGPAAPGLGMSVTVPAEAVIVTLILIVRAPVGLPNEVF